MLKDMKKIGQIPVFMNKNRRMDGYASRRNCEKLHWVWVFDGQISSVSGYLILVATCYYHTLTDEINWTLLPFAWLGSC